MRRRAGRGPDGGARWADRPPLRRRDQVSRSTTIVQEEVTFQRKRGCSRLILKLRSSVPPIWLPGNLIDRAAMQLRAVVSFRIGAIVPVRGRCGGGPAAAEARCDGPRRDPFRDHNTRLHGRRSGAAPGVGLAPGFGPRGPRGRPVPASRSGSFTHRLLPATCGDGGSVALAARGFASRLERKIATVIATGSSRRTDAQLGRSLDGEFEPVQPTDRGSARPRAVRHDPSISP
jgi:hypothetical protein